MTDLSTIVEVGATKNPEIKPAKISNFNGTFSKVIFLFSNSFSFYVELLDDEFIVTQYAIKKISNNTFHINYIYLIY
jgi:hypothetical protein